MKSFRFSYILAMLLAGGATTALTGCIDTTEPAGITELRGAKALLLKARAAFIDAKTQRENVYMEQDKVQLEQDKIDLEISKLNLELQKAVNDLKMDSTNAAKQLVLEKIQKERDALALKAEEQWWTLQEQITTAEKSYKKAVIDLQVALLTYKDDKIANKIQKYTEQLYGVGWNDLEETPSSSIASGLYGLLNQANLDLVEAQREKVLYTASTEDYLNTLSLQQTEKQNVLKIQQDLLDRMKTLSEEFAQDSLQAVKERLIEIDDAIAKLDEKKRDLYNEAQEVKTTKLAAVSEKVAEYEAVLRKDTTFVLDIVDEKLQNDLYNALSYYNIGSSSFEEEDGKYVMTSPVEIKTTVEDLSTNSSVLNIKNGILNKLQSLYYNGFIKYVTTFNGLQADLFEADGVTVKGAYAAQLKNELQRLELDKEDLRQEYKDALDKWLKTYETLDKAVTNYGGYKEVSAKYTAATKAIDDYKTAISELDAGAEDYEDDYLKLSQDLRDKLVKDYFAYRAPIDSVSSNYLTLKKNYIDKDKDGKEQLTKDNMTDFYSAVTSKSYYSPYYYNVLGTSTFVETYASYNSGKGALQEFLKAEGDLFRDGSSTTYLESTLQPEKTSDGKYVAPAGINAENYIEAGISYSVINENENSKFYKAVKTYENNQPQIFTTLPDWVSLYTEVDEQIDQAKDRVDALIAAKKAIVKENQEAYTAMWEKEVECYLIDGENNFTIGEQNVTALSEDNPYFEYYIGTTNGETDPDTDNPIVKPSVTEKGTLKTEKALLEALIQQQDGKFTNVISYVEYDETTGTYKPAEGRWEELVAAQQKVVEAAQEELDNLQQRIDLLNELGYIEYKEGSPVTSGDVTINTTVGSTDKYVELLDKEIEQAQKKVEILQAEFDKVQAKIQALIDAAADENFGSSDATYPGFEVDNSTSTNTPSTDTPSTDTPSGDATDQEQPATEEPA